MHCNRRKLLRLSTHNAAIVGAGLEGPCLRGRLDFELRPLEKQREKIPSGSEVKVN